MLLVAPTADRTHSLRPPSVATEMPPGLVVPDLRLPGPKDAGRTIAKLGLPPAPGSAAQARDERICHAVIAQRTPQGDQWAHALDLRGSKDAWLTLAEHAAGKPSVAQALVGAAFRAAGTQSGILKNKYQRPRPFQVDPSIDVIGRTPKDASYPSAHAARAYAAARVLATYDPALTELAYQLAYETAISRIYAGVHFPSDVIAGARLGTALANSVMTRYATGTIALAPVA